MFDHMHVEPYVLDIQKKDVCEVDVKRNKENASFCRISL